MKKFKKFEYNGKIFEAVSKDELRRALNIKYNDVNKIKRITEIAVVKPN